MGKTFTQDDIKKAKKEKEEANIQKQQHIEDIEKEVTELVLQNVDKYALDYYCDKINNAIHKIKNGEYVASIKLFEPISTKGYVNTVVEEILGYRTKNYLTRLKFIKSSLPGDSFIPIHEKLYTKNDYLPWARYQKIINTIQERYPDTILKTTTVSHFISNNCLMMCYFDKESVPKESGCCIIL